MEIMYIICGLLSIVLFILLIWLLAKRIELMFEMLKYYKYHNSLIDAHKEFYEIPCNTVFNDKAD